MLLEPSSSLGEGVRRHNRINDTESGSQLKRANMGGPLYTLLSVLRLCHDLVILNGCPPLDGYNQEICRHLFLSISQVIRNLGQWLLLGSQANSRLTHKEVHYVYAVATGLHQFPPPYVPVLLHIHPFYFITWVLSRSHSSLP